jgi:hypothetical protein
MEPWLVIRSTLDVMYHIRGREIRNKAVFARDSIGYPSLKKKWIWIFWNLKTSNMVQRSLWLVMAIVFSQGIRAKLRLLFHEEQ